ncbi:UDP-N-acetylmuramoyl-tripeptide--D-alanyl-D-alanine ligase [Caldisericum exile]|uniref:UDP-N-acetylmuramoyl-tripeptide--D-alanyl-D-alanine ligase n=1 Tax=Caldisericum exile (strain DSM 21853 / NBRC 104410 / AZM16c01) TaxID=511051 RepID=A0A7U6GFD1_CALEA|nr:UDP-N-acetylmuramoyl-tripeptide--D-alanyl-D-alanine ligase [Caldisericum exile]BAL81311.1 UDP-N-acetylmuramoyl-tripeptide--D-alanyl-D-alanine ligase [Caldisericum exile AZM16c01]
MKIDLQELFKDIYHEKTFSLPHDYNRFVIDSREVVKGDIFIALKGNTTDGHNFVSDALERGAIFAVVENDLKVDGRVVKVNSTFEFLKYLGNFARKKVNSAIFGITGSAGKTTTKEGLYLALSKRFNVIKTEGNINTDVSLPLFFANEITNLEDFVVVEMGVQKPNDMNILLDIVRPHYGIITNVGDSHLEYLKDRKGVLNEKFKLVRFVLDLGGVCFINGDDELLYSASNGLKGVFKVGFNKENDFRLTILEESFDSMKLKINVQDRIFEFTVPYNGFAYNVGLIFASSVYVGVDPDYVVSALREFKPYKGRGEKIKLGSMTIIDDTYNSNPISMNLALERLKGVKGPVVLILGDMLELGEYSKTLHEKVGESISKVNPYALITYGNFSKFINEKGSATIKYHFEDSNLLSQFLKTYNFKEGTYFLVKGSRGMKMEQFVQVLKERYGDES